MRRAKTSNDDHDAALVLSDMIEEHRLPAPGTNTPEGALADRVFVAAIGQWLKTRRDRAKELGVTGAHWTTGHGFAFWREHIDVVIQPGEHIDVVMQPGTGLQSLADAFKRALALETHLKCLFCDESVATLDGCKIFDRGKGITDAVLRDVLVHTRSCGIQWLARLNQTERQPPYRHVYVTPSTTTARFVCRFAIVSDGNYVEIRRGRNVMLRRPVTEILGITWNALERAEHKVRIADLIRKAVH